MTIQQILIKATKKLSTTSDSPALDSEVLLSYVLKKPKEYLLTNPNEQLLRYQLRNYNQLINRRHQGWPVAYLTGHKEFYGLDFIVNKNVLVPRPETEKLVELALQEVKDQRSKIKILDIGTGSGNIIISIAKASSALFFASDISASALRVAKHNAKRHGVKIKFKQGSLLSPWKGQHFDIIVANLPYLAKETHQSTKYEPKNALIAKNKGLEKYEKLLCSIPTLSPLPSALFFEFDPRQKIALKKLAKKFLPSYEIKIYKDLSHKNRYAVITKTPPMAGF